eukprot:gene318-532_t
MAGRAALGRALVASGSTILGLGAATMVVSSVSMGIARVVVTQNKACIRDMFSFTMLLSVFITCEPGAAAASAVSVAGAALPLESQGAEYPGTCGHQAAVLLPRVQQVLGVLGGGLLMQFFTWHAGLSSDSMLAWLLPVTAGAAAVMIARRIILSVQDEASWAEQLLADWPAWSATLLLILQPLRQLCHPAGGSAAGGDGGAHCSGITAGSSDSSECHGYLWSAGSYFSMFARVFAKYPGSCFHEPGLE